MSDSVPTPKPKPFYLKKRFWVSLVASIGIAIPALSGHLDTYLGLTGTAYALVNMILSLFSKEWVID